MTLVLELPDALQDALKSEAERLGLTLHDYALRILASGRIEGERPRTGQELVAYWQREGLIGSRPDITDSSAHARALRAQAERRERS